jgi:hypothetical protein
MFDWLFGIEEAHEVTDISTAFRYSVIWLPILIAAGIAFAVWLYRGHQHLSKNRRIVMAICQALALVVLAIIVLEPFAELRMTKPARRTVLILLDTSRSMAVADPRVTDADIIEAARVMGKIGLAEEAPSGAALQALRKEVGMTRRIDLARAALQDDRAKLIEKLSAEHDVRFFSFDSSLKPEVGESEASSDAEPGAQDPVQWLAERKADGETSRIGASIQEALSRYAGQPIAGVVVLSDFQSVEGETPVRVADRINGKNIPIYTVGVGLPSPPDVRIVKVHAPEVVIAGNKVPVGVQINAEGYEGQSIDVTLDSKHGSISKRVVLKPGANFVDLVYVPSKNDEEAELKISIPVLNDETNDKNNQMMHKVKILDEKIKVLYVEGSPRWEYRYLRWVLLRDKSLDVKFLMTQGDPELARTMPGRYLSKFPEEIKDALKFDLVILGDVSARYFKPRQLDRMEDLVRKGGGSLLMVAGPKSAPSSYKKTLIESIIPVRIGTGSWRTYGSSVYPVVTKEGKLSDVTTLSTDEAQNDRLWRMIRPLMLPSLEGAKPGAHVLLSLPKTSEKLADYPLVAWQKVGKGKSMFVGTEDLWRLRREVGDRYHARFWGQAIQFLTLSRLLGANKPVSLTTNRRQIPAGDRVQIFANVMTESYEPVLGDSYTVRIERKDTPGVAVELELGAEGDHAPGHYSGLYMPTEDGSYVIKARVEDEDFANVAEFDVRTISPEDREYAMRPDVAKQVADLSGGKMVPLSQIGNLADEMSGGKPLRTPVRREKDLWDTPFLFILLVALCGVEWYMRRRDNLV